MQIYLYIHIGKYTIIVYNNNSVFYVGFPNGPARTTLLYCQKNSNTKKNIRSRKGKAVNANVYETKDYTVVVHWYFIISSYII